MATRILVFEDDDCIRQLLCLTLRRKGYEIFDFPSPVTCALVTENRCLCPHRDACADIVLTDMNMPCMTGLELIRHQLDHHCKCPPQNKAVISAELTLKQEREVAGLGCGYFRKPVDMPKLLAWIAACEHRIPADRELLPSEELLKKSA